MPLSASREDVFVNDHSHPCCYDVGSHFVVVSNDRSYLTYLVELLTYAFERTSRQPTLITLSMSEFQSLLESETKWEHETVLLFDADPWNCETEGILRKPRHPSITSRIISLSSSSDSRTVNAIRSAGVDRVLPKLCDQFLLLESLVGQRHVSWRQLI
ncbi:MAG: hypothetical protein FJ267_09530 [Planctomycetes bacterium]|nr:hypothetical protein [Planctomycetota bacterium]